MKMSRERYNEIREGIRLVVYHHGQKPLQEMFKGKTVSFMMWAIFHSVLFDWQYTDDHPSYVAGRTRILPYKDRFFLNSLYNEGLNDSHIETALLKIAKEFGLKPHKET